MDNEGIILRIKYLMGELRLRQNAFAARVGCDESNLSKQLNGRLPLTDSLLNKIAVNTGVSKQWLARGEGTPYGKTETPDDVAYVAVPASQQGLPIYDLDVTAGALSRERVFASDRIIGRINVPGVESDSYVLRVTGDSMAPVINNGDYVAVREITDTSIIYWGHIYVVLLDDYRMVKYLRRHADDDRVVLRSANPDYDDIDVRKSMIRGLFFVNKIIRVVEAG